jgi:hypothetical protein
MKMSATINELATALAKAQATMKTAELARTNPHFKSRFAGLPEVREVIKTLHTFAVAVLQDVWTEGDHNEIACCTTTLLHMSGQWIETSPLKLRSVKADPQGVGSAITYAKRYSASAAVMIVADDDDDGEEASRPPPKTNGNGHKPPTPPLQVAPEEQLAAELCEVCEAGFSTAADKESFRIRNKEKVNQMAPAFRKAVAEAFEKATVRS